MATPSIAVQIRDLRQMTVAQLQEKHLELYGAETRSRHKDQLFKRLAWRIQELEYGGLSERAKRRALEIANDLDARIHPPRRSNASAEAAHEVLPVRTGQSGPQPSPGTILTREYRGEVHQVTVLEQGCEYNGKVYRSLSGIAKEITGTQWNGKVFFGLKPRSGK